jgi:hypothetical protein
LLDPFLEPLRRGTFAPFLRASLRPIAIACLRLLTRRPDPLFNVPFFFRCIADFTLRDAADLRFAIQVPPQSIVLPIERGGQPQRWHIVQ